ncbi:MAG TPA: galactose-1-phosphate uridylyltransferase [bacterium]|nr:galactose-1-phosphate uridylyltransferase [bacterium]
MSEIRRDPITTRWVAIAPEIIDDLSFFPSLREDDSASSCPFCPGNEALTPASLWTDRMEAERPDEWHVRVFPNRTPILQTEVAENPQGKGVFDFMNGLGAHEVVVHGREHTSHLSEFTRGQIAAGLRAYRDRMADLSGDRRLHYVMVHYDRGRCAGAALAHPYSQIVATPKVPAAVEEELNGARSYYLIKERCVFCDVLTEELRMGTRMVVENEFYAAFCPFASRSPYEVWLLPKMHQSDYTSQTDTQLEHLAETVQSIATKIDSVLGEPALHMALHSSPNLKAKSDNWRSVPQDFHWHMEFIPRVLERAAFEWGIGFHINPVAPEKAAQALRTPH